MKRNIVHLLILLCPLPCMALDSYIAANNHAQIVRVDRIPLDGSTMIILSQALSTLAQREQEPVAEELRCSAQLIGLALRLDGKNEHALRLNKLFLRGKIRQFTDPKDFKLALRKIEKMVAYLEKEAAGKEANLLSDMIKDTLLHVDGGNVLLKEHAELQARWLGIVPTLKAYSAKEEVLKKASVVTNSNNSKKNNVLLLSEKNTLLESENGSIKPLELPVDRMVYPESYALQNATLLYSSIVSESKELELPEDNEYRYYEDTGEVTSLSVQVRRSEETEMVFLEAVSNGDLLNEDQLRAACEAAMTTLWSGELPKGKLEFTIPLRYSYLSKHSVAAPMVMMVHSLLSGEALNEELVIGFSLAKNGDFIRPDIMWSNLKALRKVESDHRILITPSTEDDVSQLIAMDEWQFLLQNEIIAVSSLAEAVVWSGEEVKTDFYALASALFEEVQQAAPVNSSIKTFIENPFVREKLIEIVELCPAHISAKLLLTAGSGEGEETLDPRFFAMDIVDITRPLAGLLKKESHLNISSEFAYKVQEELELQLEILQPYVPASEVEFFESILEMNLELRSLGRSLKKKGDSFHDRQAIATLESLKTLYLLSEARLKDLEEGDIIEKIL